jgi:hypothetical protein
MATILWKKSGPFVNPMKIFFRYSNFVDVFPVVMVNEDASPFFEANFVAQL